MAQCSDEVKRLLNWCDFCYLARFVILHFKTKFVKVMIDFVRKVVSDFTRDFVAIQQLAYLTAFAGVMDVKFYSA